MKDALSHILEMVKLKGTLYFRTDFSAPFAIEVPHYARVVRFHLVLRGQCHVSLPGGNSIQLGPGDLALVPYGSAHILSDMPQRKPTSLDDVVRNSGYTGEGTFVIGEGDPHASTHMLCGHFSFADGADHPFLRAMPPLLHIDASQRAIWPMLDDVLKLLERRVFAEGPGAAFSVGRLSEILFIEAVRAATGTEPQLQGMLSAAYDQQIGRALMLVHQQLYRGWTLDEMAKEVGMSRSRFAESFRMLVGEAPMQYVSERRLLRAQSLLKDGRVSVQEVAHRTGYKSAAAFSRAFQKKFGRSPREEKSAAE